MAACLIAMVGIGAFSPAAYASAPGPNTPPSGQSSSTATIPGTGGYVLRDPTWVAEKNAFEVYSGFRANPKTGSVKGLQQSGPYIIRPHTVGPRTVCCGGSAPPSYELPLNNPVPGTWEPGGGCTSNYGTGTSEDDDYGVNYCVYTYNKNSSYATYGDHDFFNLCGPGAADVALWYWPYPDNLLGSLQVTDTSTVLRPAITTSWKSERMRAYMAYLAWQIGWPSNANPNLGHRGMMDDSWYPSYGTTLYGMVDALNWEETNQTTLNGFYALQWYTSASQSVLDDDVVSDTYGSGVPVVAEVDADYLPNWYDPGTVYHFITIIGYDNNAGIYYYTDTCGRSTNCNWTKYATDGAVHTIPQSQMWQAITAVTLNKGTEPWEGDGGWVW